MVEVTQVCQWWVVSAFVFFDWSQSLDKVTQNYIKAYLQF